MERAGSGRAEPVTTTDRGTRLITGPAEVRSVSGPLAFARFAAPPNVLGYCGGDDHATLVEHLRLGLDGPELVRLCRAFEGAWPYLELIAASAGIRDRLDPRVVEAYWIGSPLLRRVPVRCFSDHLGDRFRSRTTRSEWLWLAGKPVAGARPHHSFHVLEVMPRIGMLRAGMIAALLPAMEQCLVRPATVIAGSSTELLVAVPPLVLVDGRLAFGPPQERRVASIGRPPDPGRDVAVHWHWSCGPLSRRQAASLRRVTAHALRLAAETT